MVDQRTNRASAIILEVGRVLLAALLAIVGLTIIGGALFELCDTWGLRSAYNVATDTPPSFWGRLLTALIEFAIGMVPLAASALVLLRPHLRKES